MPLYIVEKLIDGITVLDLRGRLVLGPETAQLRGKVQDVTARGNSRIILNLEGVTYIDSSGLSTLLSCLVSTRKLGGELKLTHLTTRVRDLLQITRLSTIFETYDSVEEARRAFEQPPRPLAALGQ